MKKKYIYIDVCLCVAKKKQDFMVDDETPSESESEWQDAFDEWDSHTVINRLANCTSKERQIVMFILNDD